MTFSFAATRRRIFLASWRGLAQLCGFDEGTQLTVIT